MPQGVFGGHSTFWQQMGQGPRAALLIHCMLADSGSWSGLMRRLGGDLSATAFDLPGHGDSANFASDGDLLGCSVDVAQGLLPDGAPVVMGHSFGAVAALGLAVRQPARMGALVLFEPTLFAAAQGTQAFVDHDQRNDHLIALIREGKVAEASEIFADSWGMDTPWDLLPDFVREGLMQRLSLVQAAEDAVFRDSNGLLAPGRIEAITAPVLLVEGAESPAIIDAIGTALGRRLPNVARLVVPGASHMVPLTHARKIAPKIAAFLRDPEGYISDSSIG